MAISMHGGGTPTCACFTATRKLVPDAPQDWAELKAAALAAVAQGKEGVIFNGGRWEGTTFDWLAQFWAQGGDLVDDARQADLRRRRRPRKDAERP